EEALKGERHWGVRHLLEAVLAVDTRDHAFRGRLGDAETEVRVRAGRGVFRTQAPGRPRPAPQVEGEGGRRRRGPLRVFAELLRMTLVAPALIARLSGLVEEVREAHRGEVHGRCGS